GERVADAAVGGRGLEGLPAAERAEQGGAGRRGGGRGREGCEDGGHGKTRETAHETPAPASAAEGATRIRRVGGGAPGKTGGRRQINSLRQSVNGRPGSPPRRRAAGPCRRKARRPQRSWARRTRRAKRPLRCRRGASA